MPNLNTHPQDKTHVRQENCVSWISQLFGLLLVSLIQTFDIKIWFGERQSVLNHSSQQSAVNYKNVRDA